MGTMSADDSGKQLHVHVLDRSWSANVSIITADTLHESAIFDYLTLKTC